MNKIEVFRTNVNRVFQSQQILESLSVSFPDCKINFDLEDCDNILRIEGIGFENEKIKNLVSLHGYWCEELEP